MQDRWQWILWCGLPDQALTIGEDAAIKRVLQDKRFKVQPYYSEHRVSRNADGCVESRTADHANCPTSQHRRAQGLLLLKW